MTRALSGILCLAVFATTACRESPPTPTPPLPDPVAGTFILAVDSIEISGPGQGRIGISIPDTTPNPVITTTGGLVASIESSGGAVRRRVLVVDAPASGQGTVTLANKDNRDSVIVVATALTFKAVAAAYDFGCALAVDGRAWCWGQNGRGQIGAPTTPPCFGGGCQYSNGGTAKHPLPVMGNRPFVSIAVSGKSCDLGGTIGTCGATCAVTSLGETYCWGVPSPNRNPARSGPDRLLKSAGTSVTGSSAFTATSTTCGLNEAGEAYCLSPTGSTRTGGSMTFSSLSVSSTHSCGIAGGDVYCWGNNTTGALGIGTTDTQAHPLPEKAVAPASFNRVAVGDNYSCALATDGRVFCWGSGFSATGENPPPVCPGGFGQCSPSARVITGSGAYDAIAVGASHPALCATTASESVDCWTAFNAAPRVVQSPVALTSVSVGGLGAAIGSTGSSSFPFTCGVSPTGDIYCWLRDYVAKRLGLP